MKPKNVLNNTGPASKTLRRLSCLCVSCCIVDKDYRNYCKNLIKWLLKNLFPSFLCVTKISKLWSDNASINEPTEEKKSNSLFMKTDINYVLCMEASKVPRFLYHRNDCQFWNGGSFSGSLKMPRDSMSVLARCRFINHGTDLKRFDDHTMPKVFYFVS